MSSPDVATGRLLWQVTTLWRAAVDRAVGPLGLTHAQYSLLGSLYGLNRQGRQPSQRELADYAGLDPVFVSKLAKALSAAGLIARSDHADDPRAFQLSLTEHGQAVVQQAIGIVHALQAELTAPIGGPHSARNRELVATLTTLLGAAPGTAEGSTTMVQPSTAPPPLTGQAVAEAQGALAALMAAVLDGSGISPTEYVTMRAVALRGPWDGPDALAAFLADQPQLNLSATAAARLVDGLREHGLITTDQTVALTAAGANTHAWLTARLAPVTADLYTGFDDDDLATAQRVLAALTKRAQELRRRTQG
ncbi:MarR family winged helix-turn-helix transcriptional regulator [Micromonospora coerulea]|uniref:MarR family winged helix-turn-helix transcriptional regulator n=1 Tax=Micromonospora coerulea TaxID=47856 RepID=UPI0031F72FCB